MFKGVNFYSGDELKINGTIDDNAKFVSEKQLKNAERWNKLVEPFITKEDSDGYLRIVVGYLYHSVDSERIQFSLLFQ